LLLKVTGRCVMTATQAGTDTRVFSLVVPDGEIAMEVRAISGLEVAAFNLWFRDQGAARSAGVYPSAKFGANAAWFRLQVLTHNLLELLKATALDRAYRHARPKRLRFAIFTQFGRVVRHARQQFVRLVTRAVETILRPAQRRLALASWPGP